MSAISADADLQRGIANRRCGGVELSIAIAIPLSFVLRIDEVIE